MRRLSPILVLIVSLYLVPAASGAAGDPTTDRDCLRFLSGVDLQSATIPQLQSALAKRRFTSVELVQRYLARIDAYRGYDAIRAINPDVLEIARALDRERRAGRVRGPLHGIPLLLKDNVGTKDMPTTAGSIALQNWQPTQDAFLTARFREAGAIILGKTNLSEFANWMSTIMPSGFSTLGGQVTNAFDGGNPSGSSSGSGVAASLALAAGTIGTETSGSILSPSQTNSVVGLKTTRGIVSRTGIIPLAESFDVPGPIVRNITDAATMLTAIEGNDPDDHATAAIPATIPRGFDFTKGLRAGQHALDGMVLAYNDADLPSATTATGVLYRKAFDALAASGAKLVDTDGLASDTTTGNLTIPQIYAQFHANLDHYLEITPHELRGVQIRSLADIVAYNTVHADKVPYGQDKLITTLATPGHDAITDPLGNQIIEGAHTAIDSTLDAAGAVAYVAPNSPNIGLGARAGHPTVFLPLGRPGGSRIGIGFLGRRFSEPEILRAAYAVERAVAGANYDNRVIPTAIEGGATPTSCAAAG